MANFDFKVEILDAAAQYNLTHRKILLVEALCYGFSNKSIAEELSISVKSVERIISELNLKLNQSSAGEFREYFNPRLRLVVSLISHDLVEFSTSSDLRKVDNLNLNLNHTLVLSCVGFSNRKIAKLLSVTEKAIELRFSQLFDYFNIDTKSLDVENPRVNLFISAYCRGNINKNQLRRLYRETQVDRLPEMMDRPRILLDNLDADYKFIG